MEKTIVDPFLEKTIIGLFLLRQQERMVFCIPQNASNDNNKRVTIADRIKNDAQERGETEAAINSIIDNETYKDILVIFTLARMQNSNRHTETAMLEQILPPAMTAVQNAAMAENETNNNYYNKDAIDNVGKYVDIDAYTQKAIHWRKEGGRVIIKKHHNGSINMKYVLTREK